MSGSLRPLVTSNHDRDAAGLRHVYPVVSRRAGGVSVGINLNPNNACNWACIYCQVPNLVRGTPPPLDLGLLEAELNQLLDDIQHGDFMQRQVPEGARVLQDVAFSGNGEPTTAPEFAEAVALVQAVLQARGLTALKLRLISNGSQMLEPQVQAGLCRMAAGNGEVWFKLDAVDATRMLTLNGVQQSRAMILRRLQACAQIVPTWVQSCWFALDGAPPPEAELAAYLALLAEAKAALAGVLLYGLARPSLQPGAARLSALPADWFVALGARIEALGLRVQINP